uniref:Uncharacterized protein n=1 Tax=Onchocerca volvulus TaxID=6282 RepID=A0A8R1TYI7_ONCVO
MYGLIRMNWEVDLTVPTVNKNQIAGWMDEIEISYLHPAELAIRKREFCDQSTKRMDLMGQLNINKQRIRKIDALILIERSFICILMI